MPYADRGDGGGPLIPRPELRLPALRQAVAALVPARLPEYVEDLRKAFVRAGDEDSFVPIRMFYRRWGVVVEIEWYPETARRLHAAEQAISSPDPAVRDRAIKEAASILRAVGRLDYSVTPSASGKEPSPASGTGTEAGEGGPSPPWTPWRSTPRWGRLQG